MRPDIRVRYSEADGPLDGRQDAARALNHIIVPAGDDRPFVDSTVVKGLKEQGWLRQEGKKYQVPVGEEA